MASTKKLGVLQLNTQFYRPPGDCGNPKSYSYPVVISIVEAATREKVVLGGREGQMALVDAFVKEGKRLMKEENVTCLITSCGFMAATHKELAEQPVLSRKCIFSNDGRKSASTNSPAAFVTQ
ncbi:hypothetical protein IW261DRAFT_1680672 [Armillaria novae-zelandiae]|uniref:Uncharacterized protein n=1 Tax=Armillaria novae-zelandiae TaxID=153914 RepID=A0AA39NTP1_9AGAR|nr:hypothetical protein IW261DRAFT_1408391 [Armillaria novae-zelandiae]KAK0464091.1 hypothetical protein IW261DRAFT_1407951 [Armillaria novae-zelandiae]KAK0471648.1 hypothetical protein IW261DRAFT_1612035 [Armillaria novae-zelandiae]KAK0481226.1 hypothetical protein IW261DRAFT_1680672 [Armillaria novae-zelandiae]